MPELNPYAPGEISTQKITARPIEYPGHQIKLSIIYDMTYLTQAAQRATSLRSKPTTNLLTHFFRLLSVILFASAGLLGLFTSRRPHYLTSFILVAVAIYMALNHKIVDWIVRRKFRSLPHFNQRLSFLLTDEGLFSGSDDHKSKVLWYAFNDVIDFSDGVLLCQSKQLRYWLPFAAAENASDAAILYSYILSRLSPKKVSEATQAVGETEPIQNASFVDKELDSSIRATIVTNEEYQLENIIRYRKYRRRSLVAVLRYFSIIALASAAIYFAAFTTHYWVAAFMMLAAGIVLFYLRIRIYFVLRDLRSARHYKMSFAVTLSNSGFYVKSPIQEGNVEWVNFSDVEKFPDGVLLVMGKANCFWISFDALMNESDASRLYEFVSSRIAQAKAAKQRQTTEQAAGSLT